MWALLSRRLRTFVLLSVALPLVGALARALAERIERHRGGPTRTTRALHQAGELAGRRGVGPLAYSRPEPEPEPEPRRRRILGTRSGKVR
jgi:hypothetical protein